MAEKKKSIIEEALLEAKSLEDALKANTKEILAAHMSKEIESIVESSLKNKGEKKEEPISEEEDDEISVDDVETKGSDDEEDVKLDLDDEEESDEDDSLQFGDDEDDEDEEPNKIDLDLDTDLDLDAGEGVEDDDDEIGLGLELPMMGSDDESEEILDLTGASDEEVVKVFKKLSDNDEVEVVKDEGGIHLKDNGTGAEYYIKESMEEGWGSMHEEGEQCSECGSGAMYEDEEGKYCSECGSGMYEEKDEIVYEIEMNEPSEDYVPGDYVPGGKVSDATMNFKINNSDDASRWLRDTPEGRHAGSRPIEDFEDLESFEEGAYIEEDKLQRHSRTSGKQRYHGARLAARESRTTSKPIVRREPTKNTVSESKIMREYKELKTKKEEYKKALNVFKEKLNEVALFNTNLAYVNRLFTEHSTTKKEKMDILKRFDNAETIKESKNIYKTIKTELDNKSPMNESVENKVNKTIQSSKSTNLNESTAYVDPQITAIKDLMRRIS
jgi:hypothetical protein